MNKFALITGGTKGIGRAIAECLAEDNYNLLLTYSTDSATASTVAAEIKRKFAVSVECIKADIRSKTSIDSIADYLTGKDIKIDALILNAGTTLRKNFEDLTLEEWEGEFFANVHFPVFLTQKIIHQFNPSGSVVFTGSLMAVHPHAMSLTYGVTKSAVHALVKNLVKFLAPYDIRVNGVAPGFVDTEWQKAKPAEIRQSIESKIACKRFCQPAEVAQIYKMLITNRYFNGEIVVADGGYSYK
ncbi:MAG: SDR family oxidoreductase [Paludibacter sp.]|jgi:3-oxoacyl-[acyl-carrier protein] reductase|nr:SDR family oxidoreductase [Paludibacter sp.]